MQKKENFGHLSSKQIKIGDLVSWSRWNETDEDWIDHLGLVLEIKNTITSNRMVCICIVMPLKGAQVPVELFTFSLKLVTSLTPEET
jgi:hypothetical protein